MKIISDPDLRPVPADVMHELATLWDTGRAEVRGITFDLAPDVHSPLKWKPAEVFGLGLLERNGPKFLYPWDTSKIRKYFGREAVLVRKGDTIRAIRFEEHVLDDDPLLHPTDRHERRLALVLERKGKVTRYSVPLYMYMRGSFEPNGLHYDAVLLRALSSLGLPDIWYGEWDQPTDGLEELSAKEAEAGKNREKVERVEGKGSYAELVIEAAREADLVLNHIDTIIDDIKNGVKNKALMSRLAGFIDRLMDECTRVGYDQAASEFAPQGPTVRRAMKNRKKGIMSRQDKAKVWHFKAVQYRKEYLAIRKGKGPEDVARHVVKRLLNNDGITIGESAVGKYLRGLKKQTPD